MISILSSGLLDSNPSDRNSYDTADHKLTTKRKKKKQKSKKSRSNIENQDVQDSVLLPTESNYTISEASVGVPKHGPENILSNKEYLNEIVDPNDVNLYNDLDTVNDNANEYQQNNESQDDEIIVVDECESVISEIIVVDDVSDSEIEVVEPDPVYHHLHLANCKTGGASTSRDIHNLNINDATISMDYFNVFDINEIQSKQSGKLTIQK